MHGASAGLGSGARKLDGQAADIRRQTTTGSTTYNPCSTHTNEQNYNPRQQVRIKSTNRSGRRDGASSAPLSRSTNSAVGSANISNHNPSSTADCIYLDSLPVPDKAKCNRRKQSSTAIHESKQHNEKGGEAIITPLPLHGAEYEKQPAQQQRRQFKQLRDGADS